MKVKLNKDSVNKDDVNVPRFAYWADEGKVMGGPYPSCPNNKIDFKDIDSLLDSGVRTFIDLTERHEVRSSGVSLKRCDYREALREACAARGLSVKVFNRAWHGNAPKNGVAYYWCPIGDLRVPKVWQVEFALKMIEASIKDRGSVYVHCRGGVGRTGVINGSWLIRQGMTEKEAVERINGERRRRNVPLAWMTSPERPGQFRFLRVWESRERGTTFKEDRDVVYHSYGKKLFSSGSKLEDAIGVLGAAGAERNNFLCGKESDDDGSFVYGGRHVPGSSELNEDDESDLGGVRESSEWFKNWERRWQEMRRR